MHHGTLADKPGPHVAVKNPTWRRMIGAPGTTPTKTNRASPPQRHPPTHPTLPSSPAHHAPDRTASHQHVSLARHGRAVTTARTWAFTRPVHFRGPPGASVRPRSALAGGDDGEVQTRKASGKTTGEDAIISHDF
nr:unnamed protein product [Digitaria exilis]